MKHEQTVQVELQEYICMVKRIDGVVAQKLLEQELIRCKDCKHRYSSCPMITIHPKDDWFCFMGERKEE